MNHYQFSSVSAFARHIGLNRAENLFQIKKGNNDVSRELAENICRLFPEVSKAWLMTGENQMLIGPHEPEGILRKIIEIPLYINLPINPPTVNPDTILYCTREIANNAELATMYRGNSLLPTYKSGAILFMKKWGLTDELIYGDVYYIRTENFSKVRIVRKGACEGYLRLTTYQPDKYDDMVISREDIILLYHVCGANIT